MHYKTTWVLAVLMTAFIMVPCVEVLKAVCFFLGLLLFGVVFLLYPSPWARPYSWERLLHSEWSQFLKYGPHLGCRCLNFAPYLPTLSLILFEWCFAFTTLLSCMCSLQQSVLCWQQRSMIFQRFSARAQAAEQKEMRALGCLPAARHLLVSFPLGCVSAEVAGPVLVGSVGGWCIWLSLVLISKTTWHFCFRKARVSQIWMIEEPSQRIRYTGH